MSHSGGPTSVFWSCEDICSKLWRDRVNAPGATSADCRIGKVSPTSPAQQRHAASEHSRQPARCQLRFPGDPDSFTRLRPYLAHFCPVFSRFLRVFTVSTRRFQRATRRNPGTRNSRQGNQEGLHSSTRASNLRAGQVLHRVENRLRVWGLEGRDDFIEYRRESLAPLPSQFEMMN